jgi:prepilin peptidase CpaA
MIHGVTTRVPTMAELFLLVLVPALFVAAAVWDVTSFTIPNKVNLALLVLFAAFVPLVMASGDFSWSLVLHHLAAGLIGLVIGVLLFAAGQFGGGDAKLFAVAALWLGLNALFEYALVASLIGGGVTLVLLFLRRLPVPVMLMKYDWFVSLTERKRDVPYGVALSLGALIVLPGTDLFRFAISG